MPEDITKSSPLVGYRPPAAEPEAPDYRRGLALGTAAVNAFATGVTVNAKRQQLENQLASYALRQQKMEQDRELSEQRLGLAQQALIWKHEKDKEQIASWSDKLALADREVAVKEQLANLRETTKLNQLEAIAGAQMVASQLEAEGIFPGDPRYEPETDRRLAPFAAAGPAFIAQTKRNAFNRHKFAAETERHNVESETKNFYHDIGRILYSGNYTVQPLDPILHPEKYAETTTEGGIGVGVWRIGGKKVPTGKNIVIPDVSQPGGGLKDNIVSMKEVNDLKKRWEDIETRRSKLLPPVNRPDVGVYGSEPRDMREKAQRAINDPLASPEEKAAAQFYLDSPASQPSGQPYYQSFPQSQPEAEHSIY